MHRSVLSSQFSVLRKGLRRLLLSRRSGPLLRTENRELRTRFWSPGHGNRCCHQIGNRQRQQKLPAERHQLVVAEARQRPAHPDIKKEETENLRPKPEQRQQRPQQRRSKQRPVPSPEK